MEGHNRGDIEERLLDAIGRILETAPSPTEWPPGARTNADLVASELLRSFWELRRTTAEGSPIRHRYDEVIEQLHDWQLG